MNNYIFMNINHEIEISFTTFFYLYKFTTMLIVNHLIKNNPAFCHKNGVYIFFIFNIKQEALLAYSKTASNYQIYNQAGSYLQYFRDNNQM